MDRDDCFASASIMIVCVCSQSTIGLRLWSLVPLLGHVIISGVPAAALLESRAIASRKSVVISQITDLLESLSLHGQWTMDNNRSKGSPRMKSTPKAASCLCK